MKFRADRIDRVTLLGAVITFASFFTPAIFVKANRIVEGTPHGLFESGTIWAPVIVILAALALLAAFAPTVLSDRALLPTAFARIFIGSGIFLAPWLLIGTVGPTLLTESMAAGRISPGAGTWLAQLGAYVLLNTALRDARAIDRAGFPRHGGRARRVIRHVIGPAVAILLAALLAALLADGYLGTLAIVKEFVNNRSRFFQELSTHMILTGVAVGAAVAIGVPLGIVAWRKKALEQPVFVIVNGIQTIPSLALFGIMIAPLAWLSHVFPFLRQLGIQGIGNAPALIALTLYALLPITRNTYTSLSVIDRGVVDSGRGMGMSRWQMLHLVEFPLSLPIVLGGIRTSAVQTVGNTAVASLIGAGGLGAFVFQGLGQAAPDLILMGVFPIILLAIIVDRAMKYLVRSLTPKGIRHQQDAAGVVV